LGFLSEDSSRRKEQKTKAKENNKKEQFPVSGMAAQPLGLASHVPEKKKECRNLQRASPFVSRKHRM